VLEPEAAFAEVDFARDASLDHPLQRAIDRARADALVFAANHIEEVSALRCPSWRRNTLRICSRLLERLRRVA